MENYSVVDMNTWKRREVFEFFKNYQDPYFNVTTNVDVSALWQYCKENRISFFLHSLHTATKIANEIEAFRIRNFNGEIRDYKMIHPGCTVLKPDNTFGFAYFKMKNNIDEFVELGQQDIGRVQESKGLGANEDLLDVIFFSVLPWVSFSSFKNARHSNDTKGIPKIVFGKVYKSSNDSYKMPISVEVHHSFLDGFHVGAFLNTFESTLNTFL